MSEEKKSMSYADAGVDVDAGNRAVALMKEKVKSTYRPEVLGDLGGFAGCFCLPKRLMQEPVLLAATDGVGTKLKLAFQTGLHQTVGQDLVAMCVNDILVQGAEPLFFLDYLACGKLIPEQVATIVGGIADGCKLAGCSLIGGETAEMPGFYQPGEYDLAGFAVGLADAAKLINGKEITAGDVIIGLASSGIHSNGFSLVRRIIETSGIDLLKTAAWSGQAWGETLLTPTKIYVQTILPLLEKLTIKGMVHITGGGFIENVPRVLPETCDAVFRLGSWPVLPVFEWLQQEGNIAFHEKYRTCNMGIGYIIVAAPEQAERILAELLASGEEAYRIGQVEKGSHLVRFTEA
ncbi:MAG: phosphoribosylformylglycinamidine cyclo-ligase [Negativicutes bacterium]|nr:phosphoribosylformylglycinamidine cyclo-ligase [Negativicutes bacterium]